jgi:hypothetical protein
MTIPVYFSPAGAGRFRIYWNNLADAAATVETASSSATEYPLANIKNIWPGYKWRSASLGAPDFLKWDLHTAQYVSCFILWNHNIGAGATIRLQGNATDSWGSPTVDVQVIWNADFLVYVFTSAIFLRWWRIIVTDAANPDGYISAGHRFLGDVFQPRYSHATRAPGFIDPSEIAFTTGGQLNAARREVYDKASYSFSAVQPADILTMKSLYKALGTNKPYFIIEDSSYPLTTVYYIRNISSWDYGPLAGGYKTFVLNVESMR